MWEAFEGAYVGRDPCNVPMEAYDPLIATVPSKAECNRVKDAQSCLNTHQPISIKVMRNNLFLAQMIFWSKTKDVIHGFTSTRDCYLTMEDTLLGSILDGLNWCGREGSKGATPSSSF